MKKEAPFRFAVLLRAFRSTPTLVLRLFVLVVAVWGIVIGLWALGLIGERGRDTIEPQRTVRLNQSSVGVLRPFFDERNERIDTIITEVHPNPFR